MVSTSGHPVRRRAAGPARSRPRCPRGRARRPRSPDTPPAAAAARRRRTGSCSPGTPPPPSRGAPETPPADAHPAQTQRAQLSSTARCSTAFVPADDSCQPSQRASSIGAGVIDRQRTMAPRRARSRPGARARATKSLRAAVSGSPRGRKSPDSAAARPIRPMRTGRNPHAPRPGHRRDRRGPARPRGATFAPGCPAVNGRRAGARRFTPPRPGGRVDKR